MPYYITKKNDSDYLMHHGIKGQKWGVRNYQNYDGTLTSKGKARLHQGNLNRSESTRRSSGNAARDYNWNSTRTPEQKLNCWNFMDSARSAGYNPYDLNTDRINKDEIMRWLGDTGEYIEDEVLFSDWINKTIRPAYGDEFADILDEAFHKNTEIVMAMNRAKEEILPQINALAAGMPTSAITERNLARQKQNEERMKSNIPASAWNERTRALSGQKVRPIGKLINNVSSGMPSSAREAKAKAESWRPSGMPTSAYNARRNVR